MRRWRSAFSSISIIFMLFVVGTAMAPTVENVSPEIGAIEMRQAPEPPADFGLLPWPEDFCISPAKGDKCAEPPPEPSLDDSSWKPVTTTSSEIPAPTLHPGTTVPVAVPTTAPPAGGNVAAPREVAPAPAPRPVEEWRSLVTAYFAPTDVDKALTVIACESGGDPNAVNPRSGAAGLFQHIPRYWPERASAIGLPGASIFDPVANVAAAAWLVYSGGWSPWNASANCW